jgi:hypothetical protein
MMVSESRTNVIGPAGGEENEDEGNFIGRGFSLRGNDGVALFHLAG